MRLAFNAATTGMNAAQTRLAVSAHNVANVATTPFTPQAVALSTAPGGAGVQAAVTTGREPGVDLNREMVEQLSARNAFQANWAVFRRANEAAAAWLDVRA